MTEKLHPLLPVFGVVDQASHWIYEAGEKTVQLHPLVANGLVNGDGLPQAFHAFTPTLQNLEGVFVEVNIQFHQFVHDHKHCNQNARQE